MVGLHRGRVRTFATDGGAAIAFLALVLVAGALVAAVPGTRAAPWRSASFIVYLSAAPKGGTTPVRESFDAVVSSGTPTAYSWNFGDGSWLNGSDPADAQPVHSYPLAGTFTVTAEVWEGSAMATAGLQITATPGPLDAVIQASPSSGTAPVTVLFTANVTGGTGTYVDFTWDFGTGGHGVGPEAANRFAAAGTYLVVLTVNDSAGATARTTFALVIHGAAGPSPLSGSLVLWSAVAAVGILLVAGSWWILGRRPAPRNAAPPSSVAPPGAAAPPTLEPEGFVEGAIGEAGAGVSMETAEPPDVGAPGPGPPGVRPGLAERRRLSHRLLVRLAELGHLAPEDTPDARWTQQGLGESLGAQQNRVSNVLRRLVAAGVIEVETRHVLGRSRRVKVYRLTPRGDSLARAYRREVTGGPRPGTGEAHRRSP